MIRVLVMIAVAGFLLSIVSLSTAAAIGGPELIARGGWNWASGHGWDWDSHSRRHVRRHESWSDAGPEQTRTFTWSGGKRLEVDVDADVTYTQAPGPAKLVITGPSGALDRLRIRDGRIETDNGFGDYGRLRIVLSAPDVQSFDLNGSGELTIQDYRQDSLELDISGSSEVLARGEARKVDIDMSGSASADLGGLKADGAKVDISGSGEATVAPTEWAELDISGSGDITLLSHPRKLQTEISGSGSIHQGDERNSGAAASGSSAASPAPAPSPGKKT